MSLPLPEGTNGTLTLIAARLGLTRTWRGQGERPWRSSKAGIVTTGLRRLDASPRALIGALDRELTGPQMAAMDARFGRGRVLPARAGLTDTRTVREPIASPESTEPPGA